MIKLATAAGCIRLCFTSVRDTLSWESALAREGQGESSTANGCRRRRSVLYSWLPSRALFSRPPMQSQDDADGRLDCPRLLSTKRSLKSGPQVLPVCTSVTRCSALAVSNQVLTSTKVVINANSMHIASAVSISSAGGPVIRVRLCCVPQAGALYSKEMLDQYDD